ncbi:MAG: hypothetical protein ACYCOU_00310 [Sulfobacillus sp.]
MEIFDEDFSDDDVCIDCGNPLEECECIYDEDFLPPSKPSPRFHPMMEEGSDLPF